MSTLGCTIGGAVSRWLEAGDMTAKISGMMTMPEMLPANLYYRNIPYY